MANFYAKYPSGNPSSSSIGTVQGEGTAGTPVGGLLTVQGDPAGTPIPISGAITATNPSVSTTGTAVPASATMVGGSDGTNLRAIKLSATGVVSVDGSASTQPVTGTGTAGTAATGVVSVQGIASMTPLLVTQSGSGTQQTVNVAQFGGSNVVTGTGTGGSGIPRVTVSSDSTLTSVGTVSTVTAVTAISNALPAGTNSIGSVIPNATAAAVWQAEGAVAFGSVTNAYATILTPSAATKIVMLRNNTNAAISFSFDAGTTTNFTLDAGDQVAIDYVANGLISTTTAIQIKYAVGAPTSGSVRANACH